MKIFKKLAISLLAANFAFMGLGQASLPVIYAAEENEQKKYEEQKENLKLALADSINVISSEVYNSYISADLQKSYQDAIQDGKKVMEKGEAASFDELRIATLRIQEIKQSMMREADKKIKNIKLKEAIERNKITVSAAKLLLETAPNKVAGVKDKLLNLIKESEKLIAAAEALL